MTLFQVPNQTSGSNIPCGFKATAKSMKVVLDSLEFSLGTGRKGPEGFVEIVSGRHRPSVIWSSHCLTSDLSTWGLAFSPLGTVSQMKRLLCNHYSICAVVTKGMCSQVWSKNVHLRWVEEKSGNTCRGFWGMELWAWEKQKNLRVSSVYDLGHQEFRAESLTCCLGHGKSESDTWHEGNRPQNTEQG